MLSSICRGLCNPSRFFYDMDRSGNLVETIPCHDEINAMVTLLLWNTHRTMQTEAPLCGCFVKALISHVFLVSKLCFNIHTFLFLFWFLFIDKYEFDTYHCYWFLYFLYFVQLYMFQLALQYMLYQFIVIYKRIPNDLKLGNTGKIYINPGRWIDSYVETFHSIFVDWRKMKKKKDAYILI